MKNNRLLLIGVLVLGTLFSCDAHKRLNRLIKKHPELVRDTSIIDVDTTFIDIPAVHQDSVLHINTLRTDTVIIEKERMRIKTFIHKDSIFIEGECMGIKDTIVSVEEIRVPYVVNHEPDNFWQKLILVVIGLLIIRYIFSEGKKYWVK